MASPPSSAQLVELARGAAEAAGDVLVAHQRRRADGDAALDVEAKTTPDDPVSAADREAEQTVLAALAAARPDDGVVGEEGQGDRAGSTGLRWVVDPLDGTVNFLHRIPQWCVSVAVEDDDGPLAGAVHHPDLGETFTAWRGGGAWLGERRLATTGTRRLDRAMVVTGFAYERALRAGQIARFAELAGAARYVRRLGAAALDLAWVAAGRHDAYAEAGLHPWDWSAGSLLVSEAGGVVTRPEVRWGDVTRTTVVAAGSAALHGELVTLLG